MASFNGAEKRYPNAIEGILAGQSLRNSTYEYEGNAEDILVFEDDDQFASANSAYAYSFSGGSYGLEPLFPRPRPLAPKSAVGFWREIQASLFVPEVSNDNSCVMITPSRGKTSNVYSKEVVVQIVHDLSRLVDGWAGTDSVAPSYPVLLDLLSVSSLIPASIVEPETEVDPDDGSVILRWFNEDASESFSLTFLGKGEVAGYLSSNERLPAWKLKVSESSKITGKLISEAVLDLITG
ncbi:hypothetical protein [Rhizobium sp.]|uniref:hypothetical protein n=1 Tax=Rhizobium sp. TaxID=391 RepID=UPI0028AA9CCC